MKKLEAEIQKPDWKQWVPLLGLNQIIKDEDAGKPLIIGPKATSPKSILAGLYHLPWVSAATLATMVDVAYRVDGFVCAVSEIAEKLY